MKSGRTHLMDATPVTLGQEFGGYARQMRLGIERVQVGAPPRRRGARSAAPPSAPASTPRPASRSGSSSCSPPRPSCRSPRPQDHFEAQAQPRRPRRGIRRPAHHRRVASPRSATTSAGWAPARTPGLGELHIPDLQPGSSIMPGKVNPVVPEAVAHGVRPGHRQRRHRSRGPAHPASFELNVRSP